MRSYRWEVKESIIPEESENLKEYSPVLRQLLVNRGYRTAVDAASYIAGELNSSNSPYLMKGMNKVTHRIKEAILNRELIAIYGDYDVDGVTATVLLVQTLTNLGALVRPYIPNRFDEGYGLNNDALDHLASENVKLVISVDCGIRSNDEVRHASSCGLDLVITDHHEPGSVLPEAFGILDPKQEDDQYPDKYLAGVGVAYKLAEALILEMHPASSSFELEDLLDLVALGTIADLAPLIGENRYLVKKGLARMRKKPRQGLFSLANVSGVPLPNVTAMHIGFYLGPRLNAAGRLESALDAYDLLMANDLAHAGELALKLDSRNRDRQVLTKTTQEFAEAMILAEDPDGYLLFAVSPTFNSGVVGLAASRLVETFYRPAIVGEVNDEVTRCSCRSIPEFHITHALDQCADLLVRYGGHAAAAGFTVRNENFEALKDRMKKSAKECLGKLDLRPLLVADMEVRLTDLTWQMLKDLDKLSPTGQGNPDALFLSRNVSIISSRAVGAEGKHLKLRLSDGASQIDAIGFRFGQRLNELAGKVDILFTLESNEYNGRISLQLNLRDIRTVLPE